MFWRGRDRDHAPVRAGHFGSRRLGTGQLGFRWLGTGQLGCWPEGGLA
ncbi:hypothetical protein [Actinomadura rudentiformis]|nr:hypothetical protein [Actinomadura rudentiformis]